MVLYLLDLLGTGVFAVSGALAAGKKRMDLFGVAVLGLVTAVGGGTIRDLILNAHPVFWVEDTVYLHTALAAAILTFLVTRFRALPTAVLTLADALGLAVFTVIGAQKALALETPGVIAVIMGVMTGVAGGIIRDILSGQIPLILRREIYATASLCGATTLVLLSRIVESHSAAAGASAAVTLGIRLAAIRWKLSLPHSFLQDDEDAW